MEVDRARLPSLSATKSFEGRPSSERRPLEALLSELLETEFYRKDEATVAGGPMSRSGHFEGKETKGEGVFRITLALICLRALIGGCLILCHLGLFLREKDFVFLEDREKSFSCMCPPPEAPDLKNVRVYVCFLGALN